MDAIWWVVIVVTVVVGAGGVMAAFWWFEVHAPKRQDDPEPQDVEGPDQRR